MGLTLKHGMIYDPLGRCTAEVLVRGTQRRRERADVRRRGRVPFREMLQLGTTVGDGRQRYGCNVEKGLCIRPSREMHQVWVLVRDSRVQCERAEVGTRGNFPSREMPQLDTRVADYRKRYGCNDEKGVTWPPLERWTSGGCLLEMAKGSMGITQKEGLSLGPFGRCISWYADRGRQETAWA